MNFLRLSHSSNLRRCHRHHFLQLRTLYDAVASLKWPRDRGLDHAVERDKLLKPLLNLKNLIISEPSKSIPLALITDSKDKLGIPFRPIEFIRKYPSIFQEFQPGSLNIQPHIKLTPEIISLSSEENLLYQSVDYKQDIAGRLLKLLMINRVNKIPIVVLERLKWELGLPHDYEKALIPEFPDYFRVIGGEDWGGNEKELELVCWGDEFAVSELEKKGAKKGVFEFSLQFSNDFEMDKKYKKWLDEWKKLPYVSPYKNAMHLEAKADESDKWVVAILHEMLNLFVGKKAERENLLYLGEYLGLRPSFKRAFLQHPGIFYVSSKIGTHTVVLREAYKRGMLNERHTLIDMRSKYIKLMNLNVVKDVEKPKPSQKKSGIDVKKSEADEVKDVEGVAEDSDSDEMHDSSDDNDESDDYEESAEVESVTNGESDDDESDEYGEAVEVENVTKRGRHEMKGRDFGRRNARSEGRMTKGRVAEENVSKSSTRSHEMKGRDFERRSTRSVGRRSNGRGNEENLPNSSTRSHEMKGGDFERRSTRKAGWRTNEGGTEENVSRSSTRSHRMEDRDSGRMNTRSVGRRMNGRGNEENVSNSSTRGRDMKARDFDRRSTRSGGWRANERGSEENASRSSSRSNGMQDRDFGRRNTSSVGRRTNGRGTEENVSRSSTRSHGMQDRDFGKRDTSSVGRRTNGRGTEENVSRSSTRSHGMQDRDFGRRYTSSVGRRTNGRGTEENVSNNSARSSRRPNVRGDDSNTPRRFTKKSDFSGRRA